MKRNLTLSACIALGALAIVACSDDTQTTNSTTTASTTTGSATGGSGGDGNGGNGGMTTSSNGGSDQGGAGQGGAGVAEAAKDFCDEYGQVCDFSDTTFANNEDCTDDFINKFDADRRACVKTHLDLAKADSDTHCPHAAGNGPCS